MCHFCLTSSVHCKTMVCPEATLLLKGHILRIPIPKKRNKESTLKQYPMILYFRAAKVLELTKKLTCKPTLYAVDTITHGNTYIDY